MKYLTHVLFCNLLQVYSLNKLLLHSLHRHTLRPQYVSHCLLTSCALFSLDLLFWPVLPGTPEGSIKLIYFLSDEDGEGR